MAELVLHLRPEEKVAFDALSEALKEGWTVEKESLDANERPEELIMRYQIARFDDPACRAFVEKARTAKTPGEFENVAADFDLSTLPQEQLTEIFFVLGTNLMGKMVTFLLSSIESDEDLEGIAALTEIRHMLLEANTSLPLSA